MKQNFSFLDKLQEAKNIIKLYENKHNEYLSREFSIILMIFLPVSV
jgi:hypothetical protein